MKPAQYDYQRVKKAVFSGFWVNFDGEGGRGDINFEIYFGLFYICEIKNSFEIQKVKKGQKIE